MDAKPRDRTASVAAAPGNNTDLPSRGGGAGAPVVGNAAERDRAGPAAVPPRDAYSPLVRLAAWRAHAPAVAVLAGRVLQRLHAYEALARWVRVVSLGADKQLGPWVRAPQVHSTGSSRARRAFGNVFPPPSNTPTLLFTMHAGSALRPPSSSAPSQLPKQLPGR